MDFVTNMPTISRKSTISVVVDWLTKSGHFIPLHTPVTAYFVVDTFSREVIQLHGFPRSILTNRDPIFLRNLWCSICKQYGTKLLRSSTYNPQTNTNWKSSIGASNNSLGVCKGQTEWLVQVLTSRGILLKYMTPLVDKMSLFELTYECWSPPLVRYEDNPFDEGKDNHLETRVNLKSTLRLVIMS